ncbi:hypothetical protein QQS21_007250 [Conoideocrella luteorostrata]|uniref:SGS-domain-containing protein n=1 Tax=Conoideocrella luteorostrata TaxID=1105319 RepID=A0AAJ0CLH4_9HYPO|nr:hypothetical protein QQS21_007250 [Conoideocrella luteorostrata]
MSHITEANKGLEAVEARDWDKAISLLSKALKSSENPAWLLGRSKALISLKRYEEALDDANLAFHTAFERNKRPLMMEAQYRRAVAYFRLGRFANGDCCCIYAMRLCKGLPAIEKVDIKSLHTDENGFWTQTVEDAQLEAKLEANKGNAEDSSLLGQLPSMQEQPAHIQDWRRASTMRVQCLTAMGRLPADDPARKVTVSVKPERKELASVQSERDVAITSGGAPKMTTQKTAVASNTPPGVQMYQSSTVMSFDITSKGVNKEKLKVEFRPDSVQLNPLVYPSGEEKEFVLDLYSYVAPSAAVEFDSSACTFEVRPNKVTLSLKKKTPGMWPLSKTPVSAVEKPKDGKKEYATSFSRTTPIDVTETNLSSRRLRAAEKTATEAADADAKLDASAQKIGKPQAEATDPRPSGPAYPTSSRSGPKNWDKIAADEEKDEEPGVHDFFQKIFKNGTPEQQRAMMKSYTESNGTTLSTDWDDVSKGKVKINPPDGTEVKEW